MTQQRKFTFALSVLLLATLALVCLLPFTTQTADAAPPAVPDFDTWQNEYTGNYYDNLNTKLMGTAFRTELKELITSTHTRNTTYNKGTYALQNVWPKSDVADPKNPNNGQMKWFYTGTVTSSSNFSGNVGGTNREHVWAKNSGDTFTAEAGPGADAHHLRPTESQLNSGRGNLGFDEVTQSNSNIVKQNNKTNYGTFPDGLCFKSGSFFYPAKGYRGATARILFYMQVRYGDQFQLDFTDGATYDNGKKIGKISTLMKWHIEEPPNEDEIYRNNVIAGIQGNRNPFIDHPEYAEMIYCNNNASYSNKLKQVVETYGSYLDNANPKPAPTAITLSPNSLSLTIGATQTITASVTPSDANGRLDWKSDKTNVATVTGGVVKAVGEGVAVITATSKVNPAVSASVTVTVTEPSVHSLSISPSALSLTVGGTRQLAVTASPTGASNAVTWNSSAPSVVNVSANGFVTAVGEGEAIITATSVKNSGVTASITVKVLSQQANTQAFRDAVGAIDSAKTLQERYAALKQAIEAYNNMDSSAKNSVATEYATLTAAVNKYNEDIAPYNEELASASDLASQAVALSVSAALLAIAVVLGKKLGR